MLIDDHLYRRYVIDPMKVDTFEHSARCWIELVDLHSGTHHGRRSVQPHQ
jgi:hypothetical protein